MHQRKYPSTEPSHSSASFTTESAVTSDAIFSTSSRISETKQQQQQLRQNGSGSVFSNVLSQMMHVVRKRQAQRDSSPSKVPPFDRTDDANEARRSELGISSWARVDPQTKSGSGAPTLSGRGSVLHSTSQEGNASHKHSSAPRRPFYSGTSVTGGGGGGHHSSLLSAHDSWSAQSISMWPASGEVSNDLNCENPLFIFSTNKTEVEDDDDTGDEGKSDAGSCGQRERERRQREKR